MKRRELLQHLRATDANFIEKGATTLYGGTRRHDAKRPYRTTPRSASISPGRFAGTCLSPNRAEGNFRFPCRS